MLPGHERLRRSSVFQRAYTGRKNVSSSLFSLYVLLRTPAKKSTDSSKGAPDNENAGGTSSNSKRPPRVPLVGFVVSKKTHKHAVDRNRAKRRLREAYRRFRLDSEKADREGSNSQYDVKESLEQWYALVWVLNEKAVNAPWQEICKRMEDCLLEASRKYGRTGGNKAGADSSRKSLPSRSEPKSQK